MMDKTPSALTPADVAALQAVHKTHAWIEPKTVELRNGIVVVDYEYAAGTLIPPKTLGETRLLAIREALLPSGASRITESTSTGHRQEPG
jgi:hypothetical protein